MSLLISNYYPDAIKTEQLSGGAVNQCYRIETPSGPLAFRLGKPNLADYGFDRSDELKFYLEAEHLGISPPLRKAIPAKGILVMDYIEGTPVDSTLATQEIPKIGALLKQLHTVKCTEKTQPATIRFIRFQLEKLKQLNALPVRWEESIEKAIQQMPPCQDLVLCHNDLAGNLILEKDRLWAFDWECAGWNDPLFDLAPLCIWYEFTPEDKQALLKAYFGHLTKEKELDQAIKIVLLFSALWSLLEVAYGNPYYEQQAQDLFARATNT